MKIEEFEKEKSHPLDYLKLIWAKKWLVVVVAVAVFGFSAWRALRQQPVYEAMTTLQFGILSTTPQVLDRLGGFLGGTRGIESEIEVLKSRVVAERAAVRLNRHYALGSLPAEVSFEMGGVGVTEETSPGSYTVTFMSDGGQYQVTDPAGRPIGLGKAGQPFEAGGISFSLSKVAAKTGSSLQIHVSKLANVADSLRGALSVNVVRGTDIVNVRVNAGDPQEAARLANAFAETYVDFTREQKIQQLLSMRRFLEKQIDSFRQDLTRTAQALAKSGMEKQSPETILEHLRNDISGGPTPYSTVTDMRQELAKRLLDLEMRRAGLQFTYTPDHRVMVQLEREIADIRSRLIKQLRREGQDMGLLDVVRESQIKLNMYNYMLQKQQETRLAEASELGSARVIDRAIPPEAPVSPNVRRGFQLGGVFVLALGIGAALLLGFLDRSVKNVQDLEQRVGLPAFGVIPQIASGSARGFLPSVTSVPQLTE
ncbi:MAG: hypothetical protein HYV04_15380, partial [Deltaproteobacteria bacterium]|nr:hypothetical protein [Deltaproteobacteria bacterium]